MAWYDSTYQKGYSFPYLILLFFAYSIVYLFLEFILYIIMMFWLDPGLQDAPWELWFSFFPMALIVTIAVQHDEKRKSAESMRSGMTSQAKQKYSPHFSRDAQFISILAFFGSWFLILCIGAILIIGIHWLVSLIASESAASIVSIIFGVTWLIFSFYVGFCAWHKIYSEVALAYDLTVRQWAVQQWQQVLDGQGITEYKLGIPKYKGRQRDAFPIFDNGNTQFRSSMNRLLDELAEKAPSHYREVLEFLPKARYDPSIRQYAGGLADGRFAEDGSYPSYDWFLKAVLHETGHNIDFYVNGYGVRYTGEEKAIEYADRAFQKLIQTHTNAVRF